VFEKGSTPVTSRMVS